MYLRHCFLFTRSASDRVLSKEVAIKKIGNAFSDTVDAKRILREMKLMKKFSHENIVGLIDLIPPPSTATDFDDIYIVQDLMDTDLHRIIYSKQTLSIDHIEYFVYQILRGLKYLHSANVLHRDLKPSNLLINANCDLRICDFGLARISEENMDQTEYVVTRWYRAPEIMLACQEYSKGIDVWSVGCILAEMLARKPLFPGTDYIAQLRLICEKLGRPPETELEFITSERAKAFMLDLPVEEVGALEDSFPAHSDQYNAMDLLKKFLVIHPEKRISVNEALEHKFMEALHNAEDEPEAGLTISFDFENENLSRERVQELIWGEIREFHPEIASEFPGSTNRSGSGSNTSVNATGQDCNSKSETKLAESKVQSEEKLALSRKRSISPSSK